LLARPVAVFACEWAAQLREAVGWVIEDAEDRVTFSGFERDQLGVDREAAFDRCGGGQVVGAADAMSIEAERPGESAHTADLAGMRLRTTRR
jgi:hypothetical protein